MPPTPISQCVSAVALSLAISETLTWPAQPAAQVVRGLVGADAAVATVVLPIVIVQYETGHGIVHARHPHDLDRFLLATDLFLYMTPHAT